ncbi:MAG: NUDIX domain-containing protein [Bacteroidetes bacterium]|nr:NUDIX domain-containing protein [Bacteroidota bacterium]
MNKKIYFNHKFIEFTEEISQETQNQQITYIKEFSEEKLKVVVKDLLSELLENISDIIGYNTHISNYEMVLNYLKNKFQYIEAGGGFIKKNSDYLFIYRHNKWDLPKGKLEKKETIEQCAVRECEEECGVKNLKIKSPLSSTYHVYKYKDGFALKQTYWFFMTTDFDKALKPQTKEKITEVKWFNKEQISEIVFPNSYLTIKDVVNEAFEKAF